MTYFAIADFDCIDLVVADCIDLVAAAAAAVAVDNLVAAYSRPRRSGYHYHLEVPKGQE